MLIGILLAINIVVCLGLIGVVLLQRSEGGALGMGGGNTGFMTARGAGDLLTRITWILFSIFLVISLVLTILTGRMGGASAVDRLNIDGLDTKTLNAPAAPPAPVGQAPSTSQPAAIQAPTPSINAPSPSQPAPARPAAAKPTPSAPAASVSAAPEPVPVIPAPAQTPPQ
ncbi:preprotein translocase subunit SecG [Caulobacter sp. DWR1-3-2b1]|uniref:preprotein translocase subunit SecG n=1 Tax=Caulobacter sp. DWR1-3-2b1 TaxID=2804670 RepID=UPI003CEC5985